MEFLCVSGWGVECLYDWGGYMRLAFPGFIMTGLNWWAFELVTFLAGNVTIKFEDNPIFCELDTVVI